MSTDRLARAALLAIVGALGCGTPVARPPERASAAAAASPAPIFRYIQLNPGRAVLGAPLPEDVRAALGAAPSDTLLRLPPGTFVGAERITLVLGAGGVLRGAVFDYAHGADFEAMVREYATDLGAPRRAREQRPGEEPADVATWEDARTTFLLRRDPNRSAWTVRAELRDRTPPTR